MQAVMDPMAMMINSKIRFILLVIALFQGAVNAQFLENQQWISGNVKYKITDDLSADIEQGFRFGEMSFINTSYTDFGISYKLNKKLKFGGGYRNIYRGTWKDPQNKDDRFYLDFSFSEKFGDFRFSIRTRYQMRYRDWHTSEMGWRPQLLWRNRLTLTYKASKELGFYFSPELFTRLNDLGQPVYNQQLRLYVGGDYQIGDYLELGLFYMNQREMNTVNPEFNHVLGLNVNFTINP